MHACIHTCIHTCIYTCIPQHTYIHTCIRTRVYYGDCVKTSESLLCSRKTLELNIKTISQAIPNEIFINILKFKIWQMHLCIYFSALITTHKITLKAGLLDFMPLEDEM